MGLSKHRFGELLELTNEQNTGREYGENDAIGVNVDKIIQPMRGKISEKDFSKFHLVPPRHFAYNPRGSRKLGIGFNDTNRTFIITFNDNVFRVKTSARSTLLDEYLFMYLSRREWDRYAEFISWGSSTEVFDWTYFCDEEIMLPSLDVQQKYVDIYNAMVVNQQAYERGLEDLKVALDSQVDKIKHSALRMRIGNILDEVDNRNSEGVIKNVQGINISKQFMPSVADINGVDLRKYKVVQKGQLAFSGMQTGRDECIRIALHDTEQPIIISPAYTVFEVKEETVIPEYVMIWFSRNESDRRGWFMSDSSVRSNLDLERFYEIQIPIPDKKLQEAVVTFYEVYITRKKINEQLKTQIKNICPILIRGSLEEGR